VLAGLLLFCAAGRAAGEDAVAKLDETLFLGKAVHVENVTVWPVYSNQPAPEGAKADYITLKEAQDQKLAEVRETGAGQGRGGEPGGQVNTVVIENKGTKPILVLAGTLVRGGKQDRQVAQDFIIQPGKTAPVGAFCVEQGRWTATRAGQGTGGVFNGEEVLANKDVRGGGQFKNDQQEVWNKVALENAKGGNNPDSGTLMASTVEETDKDALARREKTRNAIHAVLAEKARQAQSPVGLAYAIDGKISEIRTFSDPRIFERYAKQLVNTIANEGDLALRDAVTKKQEVFSKEADPNQAVELVKNVEKQQKDQVASPSGNVNSYQKSADSSGATLIPEEEKSKANPKPVSKTYQKH
jgi:hypothetical protein